MTAGLQPTQADVNNQAGQIILNARNALQQIQFFTLYLNNLGSAGLIALGFSQADADLLLTVFADLEAIAGMCNGGPAPADVPKNYLASTVPLWGGQ